MLNVYFTVDVEIWCDGWHDLDERFAEAFRRCVYGPTPSHGNYGLPYTLDMLADHGLVGVFFIESLFATRFGTAPLEEVIGLVHQRFHEVQLHVHSEWVDESRVPLLPDAHGKRQNLRDFSQSDQEVLIDTGRLLLERAGSGPISAFRAGNFGFNRDTLRALANLRIPIDSSYNATMLHPNSDLASRRMMHDIARLEGILEVPVTTYADGTGRLRHVQLSACSFREIEGLLWKALESGRQSFCILSHNFEFLDRTRTRADPIAARRLHQLCEFLARESDSFKVRGFEGLAQTGSRRSSDQIATQPEPLRSPLWKTGHRVAEQMRRRLAH